MPGVAKPEDWSWTPPAPKEKKERGPPKKRALELRGRFENVDYSRPRYVTSRRRRRDRDGDAEEGEVLE
jgi:hypothetical protein